MNSSEAFTGNGVDEHAVTRARVSQLETDFYGKEGMRVDITRVKADLWWLKLGLFLTVAEGAVLISKALGWW